MYFLLSFFGSNPMNEVVNACKKEKCNLFYSNNIYQDFKSNNCGFFCVAFYYVWYGKKEYHFKHLVNYFQQMKKK